MSDGFRLTTRDGYTEIVGTALGLAQLRDLIQHAIEHDKAVLMGDQFGDAVMTVRITEQWPE